LDPIDAIEIQRERRRRELEEATSHNHQDLPIDPQLLQDENPQRLPDQPASTNHQGGHDRQSQNAPKAPNRSPNDRQDLPIDPQLLQNENPQCPPDQPSSTNHQGDQNAPMAPNRDPPGPINSQDQVQSDDSWSVGGERGPPSSPLTDLDRNRLDGMPGAISSASGLRATRAHQKRQAGESDSTQSKKPKAVPVNTRRSRRRK